MKRNIWFAVGTLASSLLRPLIADPAPSTNTPPDWLTKPLSEADAINIALQGNSTILKSRSDIEAAYGIVVQTRAIAWPKLRAGGNYQWSDQIETLELAGFPPLSFQRENVWTAGVQLVQSIYEGGRVKAALRTARLTREQALQEHEGVLADTLLQVRTAYYDVLLAAQRIDVQRASLALLQSELDTTRRRFEAGNVPRFNVLRAEVEVANARPALIRASNDWRIAKNQLANLLGVSLPPDVWDDIPLQLTGKLDVVPFRIELPAALAQAVQQRPELAALRTTEALRREAVKTARAGYLPRLQVFAGRGWRSSTFQKDLAFDISGWNAGAQVSWDLFDGFETKGKLQEAKALHRKATLDVEDLTRRVELEVRTAYSGFVEAREVLESQTKVQEQADEALRLATTRAEAGAGVQLDVLSAQTALTQARTTQIQARRDYRVALARLERAIGLNVVHEPSREVPKTASAED